MWNYIIYFAVVLAIVILAVVGIRLGIRAYRHTQTMSRRKGFYR